MKIMINDEADKVIKEFFESLISKYQIGLLHYKCHKINPNRSGSYIDSPDWIKNKTPTINPINKYDSKCTQYAATVALNDKSKKKSNRISKIVPFICKYN